MSELTEYRLVYKTYMRDIWVASELRFQDIRTFHSLAEAVASLLRGPLVQAGSALSGSPHPLYPERRNPMPIPFQDDPYDRLQEVDHSGWILPEPELTPLDPPPMERLSLDVYFDLWKAAEHHNNTGEFTHEQRDHPELLPQGADAATGPEGDAPRP